ncbi:4'-phosphopantetheinyl transferase superfamily protein [Dyadobacter sp. CY327]|uniref:4'-phosphopantetheinyl transferase family protein n=1 Tax=Dyadobacter sp. CY327 TaxID=2907301 RepID=UPI001F2C78D9|nr:4'-phosphopantetheinyl transferase superfamily protein [Dyadobacter sp. CY327]MCE7071045.1 4'-phosphopantetheinyl transferase superfamily protein [Dyadobacter sp. CY327]
MQLSTVHCETVDSIIWKDFSETVLQNNVVVLKIYLPDFEHNIDQLAVLLSHDETIRSLKYHFEKDQHRFIIVRGILRLLLGTVSGQGSAGVRFTLSQNHKPALANYPDICYNVSHSGKHACIALSPKPIGIDVEELNRSFGFKEILETSFSEAEKTQILKNKNPQTEFYRLWTRKESLSKATGLGLGDSLTVLPAIDGLTQISNSLTASENWYTVSFDIDSKAIGSVTFLSSMKKDPIEFSILNLNWLLHDRTVVSQL